MDMTTGSSMQYTIGTALDRAREGGLEVEVLVENHWLAGNVAAADGLGVVLDREGFEHFVVRLDQISAVRVGVQAPMVDDRTDRSGEAHRSNDGAVPMPAPMPTSMTGSMVATMGSVPRSMSA
jgi:hypothetical protein